MATDILASALLPIFDLWDGSEEQEILVEYLRVRERYHAIGQQHPVSYRAFRAHWEMLKMAILTGTAMAESAARTERKDY
jgi:hypothetical protein